MTTTRSRASLPPLCRCSYDGELKKAVEIADHYGFRLVQPLSIEPDDRTHAERYRCTHEHAALMRMLASEDAYRPGETLLIAHTRKTPNKSKLELRLEAIGDRESSAEGLLFQTARAILSEYGHRDTLVTVNSVGGRETSSGFVQAIGSYLRAHLGELDPECRDQVRASLFAPLRCAHEACAAVRANAPQSLNFLSEPSRQHFKEVLEYLESLDMPYVIDPLLVGSEHYTTRTVFAMGTPTASTGDGTTTRHLDRVLAWGERYDQLAKRMGFKKPLPAAHITIDVGAKSVRERFVPETKQGDIRAFVVQVGLPAKIRVLSMHEELRKARVRVSVTLNKTSVSEQMEQARALGTPFIIVVGHKEVRDGAALIRHLPTNHQETVPFPQLPSYLKEIYATRKR